MNGFYLVVLAVVAATAAILIRGARKRQPGKLLGPGDAVRRDGAPALPPMPPKAIFEMQLERPIEGVITGGRADPVSPQMEAHDRWMVSDECDPDKLAGATAHLTINEPAWLEDPRIAQRVQQLRKETKLKEKK
jgi:hypothetical protein